MPFVESNRIKLAYEIEGDPAGEPLLLIAGLGLQLTSWPSAFRRQLVNQGFRVIRFDNRDCGLSTKLEQHGKPNLHLAVFQSLWRMPVFAGYTLYDMAKDAVGLLDALGIERAHVVGASMGGMIAQILAGQHRERVLSLTSMMSTSGRPGLPGPTPAAHQALFSRPQGRDLHSIVEHQIGVLRVLGSPAYPTPESELRVRILESARRNVCPRGMGQQVMAVASSGDRGALLRSVRTPTMIIHGSADPLVPVACGRDCARLVRDAYFHEVEGMGHDLPPALERPLADLIAAHCHGMLAIPAKTA